MCFFRYRVEAQYFQKLLGLFKDQLKNLISSLLAILHFKSSSEALNLMVLVALVSGGMYIILLNETAFTHTSRKATSKS